MDFIYELKLFKFNFKLKQGFLSKAELKTSKAQNYLMIFFNHILYFYIFTKKNDLKTFIDAAEQIGIKKMFDGFLFFFLVKRKSL